jgi:Cysteine-rich CPXCG
MVRVFVSGTRYRMNDEATYICGGCGEEIVIPVDLTQGNEQEYVEDCPVCCQANVIRLEVDNAGEISAWAELE